MILIIKNGINIFWGFRFIQFNNIRNNSDEKINIVIPLSFNEYSIFSITSMLVNSFGVALDEICYCPSWLIYVPENFKDNVDKVFSNCMYGRELLTFSYILRNDCNLSCKLCTTCSPLLKETDVVKFTNFKRDIDRLHELFDNVKFVSFQGGEILLDESLLCQCIEYFSKVFPMTDMHIRTNGSLILNLKEESIICFKKHNITIDISLYPALYRKIDDIMEFLQNNGLKSTIYHADKFTKRISKNLVHDMERKSELCIECIRFMCVQLQDGKMARCPFPRAMMFLNKEFNTEYPVDGEFDIHDPSLTTNLFYKKLLEPIGFCSYCRMEEHEYDIPHEMLPKNGENVLSDWIS